MNWGQRQIARSVQISQRMVHDYLARFVASGLIWPLPVEIGEAELEGGLFPPESLFPARSGIPITFPDTPDPLMG